MTTPTNPPAGDMTAPSEGRRTRLGEVIYGAMFEVQIDLRYGGAEKAEYIADAVRRALEEAERGEKPITLAEALAQPVETRPVSPPVVARFHTVLDRVRLMYDVDGALALTTVRPRTLTPAGMALLEAVQSTDGEHWPGCHTQHAACLARRVLEEIR